MDLGFPDELNGCDPRTREEIVSSFYEQANEDGRLQRSRHGQMEYLTTMRYIHRYLNSGSKVLEIGAGTGRYSIALAKEGMAVTAVELAESNLAALKENAKGLETSEHTKAMRPIWDGLRTIFSM